MRERQIDVTQPCPVASGGAAPNDTEPTPAAETLVDFIGQSPWAGVELDLARRDDAGDAGTPARDVPPGAC